MISVGIDVSKGKSTVCLLKPYGEIICKPFEVQYTEKDLEELANLHPSLTSYLIPRTYLFSHTQYPPPVLPKEHTDHEPGYEPGSSLCYNNNVL